LPANLTSGVNSVSRSRLSAKKASATLRRGSDPRGIRDSTWLCSPWTNGPSYSGGALVSPPQTVRFCRLWIVVDKWISC